MTTERLGKYEIRGTLGKGAMGTVYSAWDPIISRTVAIKTVRLPEASDIDAQEELARFKREAQAAGRLTHPNIVGIFDYGETDEVAFIVMEFVDGRSLKSVIDGDERVPVATIGKIMADLLAGLHYSHERGVVHRDIKPANVMIVGSEQGGAQGGGQAKIADFGIARIESSNLTQAGTIMGTPAYMSPEQFMGQTVDARTDIYSSGVLLFQLLTGERPFEGSMATIMHKALNTQPPKPSELSVTAPVALDAVVARAMARRPDDRFPTAGAFAEAVADALAGRAAPATGLGQGLGDDFDTESTVVRPATARPVAEDRTEIVTKSPAQPVGGAKSRLPMLGGVAVLAVAALGVGGAWWAGLIGTPERNPQISSTSTPGAGSPGTGTPSLGNPATSNPATGNPVLGNATTVTPPGPGQPPVVAVTPPTSGDTASNTPTRTPSETTTPIVPPQARPDVTQVVPPTTSNPNTPATTPPAPTRPAQIIPPANATTVETATNTTPPIALTPQPGLAETRQESPAISPPIGTTTTPLGPIVTIPPSIRPPEPDVTPPIPPAQVVLPREVPPTTPPTVTAAVVSPEALRRAVASVAQGADCSVVRGDLTRSGTLSLQGVIGGGAPVQNMLRDLRQAAPDAPLDWTVQEANGPYCSVLNMIRPYARPFGSVTGGIEIGLRDGRTSLREDDKIDIVAQVPAYPAYLQVDYFSGDGSVLHVQTANGASPLTARSTQNYQPGEVTSPFGTDLIVAIASSVPLFTKGQVLPDEAEPYLRQLRTALEAATRRRAEVAAGAVVVRTSPKS